MLYHHNDKIPIAFLKKLHETLGLGDPLGDSYVLVSRIRWYVTRFCLGGKFLCLNKFLSHIMASGHS